MPPKAKQGGPARAATKRDIAGEVKAVLAIGKDTLRDITRPLVVRKLAARAR